MIKGRYLVYELWHPDELKPFYVGWTDTFKNRNRLAEHLKDGKNPVSAGNPFKAHKIAKLLKEGRVPTFVEITRMDSEEDSLELEIAFIASWGRRDQGRGPLTNLTDGGDGFRGHHTEDTKERIRKHSLEMWQDPNYRSLVIQAQTARWQTTPELRQKFQKRFAGEGNPFYRKTHTPEANRLNAEAHTGVEVSPATRIKLRDSHKGRSHSEKHNRNVGDALRNVPKSPIHIQHLREAALHRHAERRQNASAIR